MIFHVFLENLGGLHRPTNFFVFLQNILNFIRSIFLISLYITFGESNRLVLQPVTSEALLENSTILIHITANFLNF